MELYKEHYKKILFLRKNFEKALKKLELENNFEKKLELALAASNYFVYNNTGYFTSSVLENFFLDYAKKIKVDLREINFNKNSILHIMSQGYQTGGHTRVVERWIENAPDVQTHSVVFTRENYTELKTLENNVKNKNGKYIFLENKLSLEEKAIELRKLGMEYEYVVLHTHMEDSLPIIAFGVEEFKRPVLLYNHGSHMAWLGKSVADIVLDIEKDDEVTTSKRGITDTYFLGVPTKDKQFAKVDKIELRKKLNLPLDKKIIVTSGGEVRYRSISGHSFVDYLKEIMDEDTYCYVIGIASDDKAWKKIKKETNNRVKTLGFIDFDKGYCDYLGACDLYLDSYPFGGGTALIDAISYGAPVLSLKSVYPQLDYLVETSAYCENKDEFIEKAKRILTDKQYANDIYEEVKKSLIEFQSVEAWNKKVARLYEIAPKEHKVRDLSNLKDYCKENDLSVLCNVITNKNFLRKRKLEKIKYKNLANLSSCLKKTKKTGIPFVFERISFHNQNKKVIIYKLFNFEILRYEK